MKKNLLIMVFVLLPAILHSQTKTFLRDYTYNAGEADSKVTSRAIALDQVKRLLLEEVGVYLESSFETEKKEGKEGLSEITKEKIISLSAGITNTKITEERWNGEQYYIKAEITLDVNEVKEKLNSLSQNKETVRQFEELKKRSDEAYAEIDKLKKQLSLIQNAKEKESIQKEYTRNASILSADDLFRKGYDAYANNQKEEAFDYYSRAIEADPNLVGAYYNRGIIKCEKGDLQGAVDDYTRAIQVDPAYTLAYYGRGYTRNILGDHYGAIEDYTKAIELDAAYSDALLSRGIAKNDLEDKNGALEDFDKAIKADPKNVIAYIWRGNARSDLGDKRGSYSDYNKAVEIRPDYAEGYLARGNKKSEAGDSKGAYADYDKAIELKPGYSDAYVCRGMKKSEFGDKRGAIIDYNKALELNPANALAYYWLGSVKYDMGDNDGACRAWQKAVDLGLTWVNATIQERCK